MFKKRKYDRKRGFRKSWCRRARKKVIIMKPAEPEKPVFSASGSALYLWMHMPPLNQIKTGKSRIKQGGFTYSLREKCADVIGANADALSASYLKEASWSCWQSVWRSILRNGTDLPEIFRMFAREFGNQFSFVCHATDKDDMNIKDTSLNELRDNALNACLIPFYKKHRVENVFSNISINDFVTFVSGLNQASVVIDCSKMPSFSIADILSLCNIPSLKGLDLSRNRQVDDLFLRTIGSRLAGRNSNLQILILSGCPLITKEGVVSLLQKCAASNLSYVETDIRLPSLRSFDKLFSDMNESHDIGVVTETQWKFVQETDPFSAASKYRLGLKFHYFSRQFDKLSASGIIWDIKFFASIMESLNENAEDISVLAWKQRYLSAMNRPYDAPFIYVKDTNIVITSTPKPTPKVETLSIFERAGREGHLEKQKSVRHSQKKPKTIKTNAQLFFFGT